MQLSKTTPTIYIDIKMSLDEAQSIAHNLQEWYDIALCDQDHQQNLQDCLAEGEYESGLEFLVALRKTINENS